MKVATINEKFSTLHPVYKSASCIDNGDDNMFVTNSLSLPTTIDGKFEVFRLANRDDGNNTKVFHQ